MYSFCVLVSLDFGSLQSIRKHIPSSVRSFQTLDSFQIHIFRHDKCYCATLASSFSLLFTARCYASGVLAMALCPSVSPSVRHKSEFY